MDLFGTFSSGFYPIFSNSHMPYIVLQYSGAILTTVRLRCHSCGLCTSKSLIAAPPYRLPLTKTMYHKHLDNRIFRFLPSLKTLHVLFHSTHLPTRWFEPTKILGGLERSYPFVLVSCVSCCFHIHLRRIVVILLGAPAARRDHSVKPAHTFSLPIRSITTRRKVSGCC